MRRPSTGSQWGSPEDEGCGRAMIIAVLILALLGLHAAVVAILIRAWKEAKG